jgi:hypothetical protein
MKQGLVHGKPLGGKRPYTTYIIMSFGDEVENLMTDVGYCIVVCGFFTFEHKSAKVIQQFIIYLL